MLNQTKILKLGWGILPLGGRVKETKFRIMNKLQDGTLTYHKRQD